MNTSAAGQKLVIGGATGMVGGYALRYALHHSAVERVTAIGEPRHQSNGPIAPFPTGAIAAEWATLSTEAQRYPKQNVPS